MGREGREKREKKESATQIFEIGKKKKREREILKNFQTLFFLILFFKNHCFSYPGHCGVFIALSQG